VLADLVEATGLSLEIAEAAIPLSPAVLRTAELLGLDPLTVANEGKVLVVCAGADAERLLAACRAHPLGGAAALLGRFTEEKPALAELITRGGGRRLINRPYGEELPRIC
jgi:hydrogenase expression/formation protein HypE